MLILALAAVAALEQVFAESGLFLGGLHQLGNAVCAVVCGLLNLQGLDIGQKCRDHAIVAVISRLIPHIGRYAQFALAALGIQKYTAHQCGCGCGKQHRAGHTPIPAPLRHRDPEGHIDQHGEDQKGHRHGILHGQARRAGHIGGLAHLCQIPRKKGLAAQLQLKKGNSGGNASHAPGHQHGQRMPACEGKYKPVHEPQQNSCGQKRFFVILNVFDPQVFQCSPLDPFGAKQCQCRCEQRIHKPHSACQHLLRFGFHIFYNSLFFCFHGSISHFSENALNYIIQYLSSPCAFFAAFYARGPARRWS